MTIIRGDTNRSVPTFSWLGRVRQGTVPVVVGSFYLAGLRGAEIQKKRDTTLRGWIESCVPYMYNGGGLLPRPVSVSSKTTQRSRLCVSRGALVWCIGIYHYYIYDWSLGFSVQSALVAASYSGSLPSIDGYIQCRLQIPAFSRGKQLLHICCDRNAVRRFLFNRTRNPSVRSVRPCL